jgi:Sulfotransferase family
MAVPVFVLAPPRSFSTVVCAMLGQHPQLYGLPELHLLGAETVSEFLRQCEEATYPMADGLVRAVAQLFFARQTDDTVARARGWLSRRAHFSTGLLFEALGRRAHPLALVEKSPSMVYDVEHLRRLRGMFPNARFIHLLRHPLGHGQSVLRYIEERTRHGPMAPTHWLLHLASYPYRFEDEEDGAPAERDPQRGWYALNANICEFLSAVPGDYWMRVRGEDLVTRPDWFLPIVAEWLGIRRDAQAIDEMKHPERSPYACYGPRSAAYGNDRLFLDSPALRAERAMTLTLDDPLPWSAGRTLHPRVTALAREFGYA